MSSTVVDEDVEPPEFSVAGAVFISVAFSSTLELSIVR
jgi:hypothetical protein